MDDQADRNNNWNSVLEMNQAERLAHVSAHEDEISRLKAEINNSEHTVDEKTTERGGLATGIPTRTVGNGQVEYIPFFEEETTVLELVQPGGAMDNVITDLKEVIHGLETFNKGIVEEVKFQQFIIGMTKFAQKTLKSAADSMNKDGNNIARVGALDGLREAFNKNMTRLEKVIKLPLKTAPKKSTGMEAPSARATPATTTAPVAPKETDVGPQKSFQLPQHRAPPATPTQAVNPAKDETSKRPQQSDPTSSNKRRKLNEDALPSATPATPSTNPQTGEMSAPSPATSTPAAASSPTPNAHGGSKAINKAPQGQSPTTKPAAAARKNSTKPLPKGLAPGNKNFLNAMAQAGGTQGTPVSPQVQQAAPVNAQVQQAAPVNAQVQQAAPISSGGKQTARGDSQTKSKPGEKLSLGFGRGGGLGLSRGGGLALGRGGNKKPSPRGGGTGQ